MCPHSVQTWGGRGGRGKGRGERGEGKERGRGGRRREAEIQCCMSHHCKLPTLCLLCRQLVADLREERDIREPEEGVAGAEGMEGRAQ